MAKFPPNAEQQAIMDAAATGKDGKVLAGAGTGKTTTLGMISGVLVAQGRRPLYLAFNRSVANAAEADPAFEGTLCRNYHRLAYRSFARQAQRRGGKYPSARFIATNLNIQPFTYEAENGESQTLNPQQIAVAVKESIGRFCQSADRQPTAWHIKRTDIARNVPEAHRERFIAQVLPYVTRCWDDIANPNGSMPFMPGRGDNCYVKLWSLSDPQLGYDAILYDEAQDANPAVAYVVSIQRDCQRIYVGDSAQAIYGWNGAVDALKKFDADWELPLSHSYRFGQTVADEANRWLNFVPDAKLRLTGSGDSEVGPRDLSKGSAILCRTNAGCIESAINAQDKGQQVYIAGGVGDIEAFTKAANELMQGQSTSHPELAAYRDWSDVQAAVKSGDADFGMMVRLIDNYGTHTILEVCRNCKTIKPAQADVVVSTAHKAKGLEWDHVRIHGDFTAPKDGGKLAVPEAMLIYVAITRARLTLDNTALAWLDALEADINETMDEGEGA